MLTKRSIPTLLTCIRLAVIPVVYVLWQCDSEEQPLAGLYLYLFALFAAASFTDFLDGWLARRWHVTSATGAMLDQIADKLLVCTLLLLLLYHHQVPATIVVILVLREMFVSGLRESLALKQVPMPVARSGKWKTALQMIGIAAVLFGLHVQSVPCVLVGHILLMVAAALSLISGALYVRAGWRSLRRA